MENNEYKAESIQVLDSPERITNLPQARKNLDFKQLAEMVKNRGDLSKVSNELNIDINVLHRAIYEAKILSLFPGIHKSKVVPLSTIKYKRELELFTKHYDIGKLEVRQLYKAVKAWRKKIEKNPKILLNSLQHDLIIGSTLGDAYVQQRNKNCNFRVGHTGKQSIYLLWKYNVMHEFTCSKPTWGIRQIKDHIIATLELSTSTHYVFNYYRELFYKNGIKRVTREILDMLTPRSLAIWLCDDGSYSNRQGYIVLCTNSYTLEEHKIMKKYFEEVWGLSPTIGFRDKKYYYLRFKQEDSKKLIEIVRPFIPGFIRYKIGEKNE